MKSAVVGLELGPRLLSSTSTEVARFTLTVLHGLTYLPLVLLPIMQDAHLKLAVVLNTCLCLCLMAGNALFHVLGIVKVFPKMLDTFLLALYASMVPVAFLQFGWLSDWVNVYHYGAVAAIVWLSALLPCWDSCVTESLKDRLDSALWELPAVTAAGRRMTIIWGSALSMCCLLTLAPVLVDKRVMAVHVLCDYVLVILLLLAAIAMQWRMTARLLAAHTGQRASSTSSGGSSSSRDLELGDVDVGVTVVQARQHQQDGAATADPVRGDRVRDAGLPQDAALEAAPGADPLAVKVTQHAVGDDQPSRPPAAAQEAQHQQQQQQAAR